MKYDDIITCLQALSRIEGASLAAQNSEAKTLISDSIGYINSVLIKELKEQKESKNER